MAGILPVGRTGQSVPAGATLMQSCMLNLHVESFERRDYGQGDLARCPETPRRHSRCGKYRTISTSSSSSRSNALEESDLSERNSTDQERDIPRYCFSMRQLGFSAANIWRCPLCRPAGDVPRTGVRELAPRRRIARR